MEIDLSIFSSKPFKSLINNILFFLCINLLVVGLIFYLTIVCLNERKPKLLKLNDNVTIVFSGDSSIECAINDSLIEHSVNIAESGESYLYSYYKIKSIIECNKQIKIIFLGFSYHNLEKSSEDYYLFNSNPLIEKIASYNYLLSYEEQRLLIKNNPKAYFLGLRKGMLQNIELLFKSYVYNSYKKPSNFGGFLYLDRNKLEEAKGSKFIFNKGLFKEALIQVKYLKLISQLCRQKSIQLILLNTPKHTYYTSDLNKASENYLQLIQRYTLNDSLLNYSNMLMPDSCFGDLMHLNFKGAKTFSSFLNKKINYGFLTSNANNL